MSINIRFPIEDDLNKNRFFSMSSISKDAISSNLLLLLLTEKGTRYYMSDYGTYLVKFIFEPNDNITLKDIEDDLKDTVRKYMPEIKIVSVSHEQPSETENFVNILYSYSEGSFGGVEQLQIAF